MPCFCSNAWLSASADELFLQAVEGEQAENAPIDIKINMRRMLSMPR
jgi:hypothetical protein